MACLQSLAETDPVLLRSWSVHRVWGRPERRLQSPPSEWPDASLQLGTLGHCVLESRVSRATVWPRCVAKYWQMTSSDKSVTGGKPVRADISAFVSCWDQCMCRIWRWHLVRNASNVFHHTKVMSKFLQWTSQGPGQITGRLQQTKKNDPWQPKISVETGNT